MQLERARWLWGPRRWEGSNKEEQEEPLSPNPAVWPREIHFSSLNLSFLIYKIGKLYNDVSGWALVESPNSTVSASELSSSGNSESEEHPNHDQGWAALSFLHLTGNLNFIVGSDILEVASNSKESSFRNSLLSTSIYLVSCGSWLGVSPCHRKREEPPAGESQDDTALDFDKTTNKTTAQSTSSGCATWGQLPLTLVLLKCCPHFH